MLSGLAADAVGPRPAGPVGGGTPVLVHRLSDPPELVMLRSGQQLVERVERLPVEQIVGIHGEW